MKNSLLFRIVRNRHRLSILTIVVRLTVGKIIITVKQQTIVEPTINRSKIKHV